MVCHVRARTGRTTISSGHGRIAGMRQRHPQPSLYHNPSPSPSRVGSSLLQALQVYRRLVAQLGNAVDEWAAAADVEQGVQAALHVVQQVAPRAAIAGMIVVILGMPTATRHVDHGSGACRGCGGDGEHGGEGKCTRGDRRVSQ